MRTLIERSKSTICIITILIIAAFLRFYQLTDLPAGLHQDEANIGYEAYNIGTYGVDRNGYPYPIYPITYGSGGGSVLMIYANVITGKLFGYTPAVLRGTTAAFGAASIYLFYLLIKKIRGTKAALFGAAFLSVCPWHLMSSRWSLDSNQTPFWYLLAMLLFAYAVTAQKRQTILYLCSAAVFSLCLYSYGAANVVIPLQLILLCIYFIRRGRLTIKQMVGSAITFFVVLLPLAIFYVINFLDLPAIYGPFFSIPKLTASRSSMFLLPGDGFLSGLWRNFKYLLLTMTIGSSEEQICNMIPGYGALFTVSIPVTLLGFLLLTRQFLRDAKIPKANNAETFPFHLDFILYSGLLTSMLFALFVEGDVTRMVLLFLPLIYCNVVGMAWIYHYSKGLTQTNNTVATRLLSLLPYACVAILTFQSISFLRTYFTDFNQMCGSTYMPGYGEACAAAAELCPEGSTIYSTYENVAAPFLVAAYYTHEDPREFAATVEYKDPDAEFRIASSFGNFVFGFSDDIAVLLEEDSDTVGTTSTTGAAATSSQTNSVSDREDFLQSLLGQDIWIISSREIAYFDSNLFQVTSYGNYAVVSSLR